MILTPDWPVPNNIAAFVSTRQGGVSIEPYDGLNLAMHVGDTEHDVQQNRQILSERLYDLHAQKPEFQWLHQVHGFHCAVIEQAVDVIEADAVYTRTPGLVCAVLTADCLPVLIASKNGREIAAVHAGWRGLINGVIESALKHFQAPASELLAFIGPAISHQHFQIGDEVAQPFAYFLGCSGLSSRLNQLLKPDLEHAGRYYFDLPGCCRYYLQSMGVSDVYGTDICSFADDKRCYSYRRQGDCGRMATGLWIKNSC